MAKSSSGHVDVEMVHILANAFKGIKMTEYPIYGQSAVLVDRGHIMIAQITSRNGKSIFGLGGNKDNVTVDLVDIVKKLPKKGQFRAYVDDGQVVFESPTGGSFGVWIESFDANRVKVPPLMGA